MTTGSTTSSPSGASSCAAGRGAWARRPSRRWLPSRAPGVAARPWSSPSIPPERLADALGLAGLSDTPSRIDGEWPGELWATMLDTTLDVRRPGGQVRGDARAGRADPRQPLLPQHRRRPVGDAGVHGDGEALRAARGDRLRPGGGGHAPDAPRSRLPRRPPAPVAVPGAPPVPHADGAEPGHRPGGERGRAGVPADRLEGGGRRRGGRRHGLLPGVRGDGGGLPAASATGQRAAGGAGDRLRAGGLAAPGHGRRGALLRRPAG